MGAAEQGWGAERWIRQHPDRLFVDRACNQPFPLDLPPANRMRVHHIVVAHNIASRCEAYFGGGSSGSLMYNSDLDGKIQSDRSTCEPFQVGWLNPDRSFVHVLDDASLDILLTARDTITDFVDYLRAKEELLRSLRDQKTRFSYPGEEELLAHYLLTMKDGRHGFDFPSGYDSIALEEGEWGDFEASPQRAAQEKADEISYSWDALIETFARNILGGTSYFTSTPRIADREKILRFFAREPRVRRRMLTECLYEIIAMTKLTQRGVRVMLPSNPGDAYYCFLLIPRLPHQPVDEYRTARNEMLMLHCYIVKLLYPDAEHIVGLATETGHQVEYRSEDAFYFDTRGWTDELAAWTRELREKHKVLINTKMGQSKVVEFPI